MESKQQFVEAIHSDTSKYACAGMYTACQSGGAGEK